MPVKKVVIDDLVSEIYLRGIVPEVHPDIRQILHHYVKRIYRSVGDDLVLLALRESHNARR